MIKNENQKHKTSDVESSREADAADSAWAAADDAYTDGVAVMKSEWFAIGTYNAKFPENTGTLWRTAAAMGAHYIFTIGERYRRQRTDTRKAWQEIPLHQYDDFNQFKNTLPKGCELIGIELNKKSKDLTGFNHPPRAVYLLGAEDYGIPDNILKQCNQIIQIPSKFCLNLSVAGSIVMYDRKTKGDN